MNLRRNRYLEYEEEQRLKNYVSAVVLERDKIRQKSKYDHLHRCLNEQRKEAEQEARLETRKERANYLEFAKNQEQQLEMQLREVKTSELCEKKERQLLRQNCQELRDLERKLNAVYVAEQQRAQIAEKEAMKLNQKLKDKQRNNVMLSACMTDQEFKNYTRQEEINRKAKYRQELQDQMILDDKNKRYAYEEFLKEKKMIDAVVQRIHEENERQTEERMHKMKRTQQEIDAFKEAQRVWKERQRNKIMEENKKIEDYISTKINDWKTMREEKERINAIKTKISDDLAIQLCKQEHQKKERQDIEMELKLEEEREAGERRHKEEIEKKLRFKMETRSSLLSQMQEHKEQLRQQAKEDALFKEQLVAQLAEDERLEQLSNEKKRQKLLQLRRDVEKMMQDRRQLYADNMQLNIALYEMEKKEENERTRVIQAERIKLLQEHATQLIGSLPKGILQKEDLPFLSSSVIEKCGGKL